MDKKFLKGFIIITGGRKIPFSGSFNNEQYLELSKNKTKVIIKEVS